MKDEEFDELERLKDQNIQLSAGGQRLLEERQAREMREAAKEHAKEWQNHIDIWNTERPEDPKYRGFDGMTLAMVLEVYSRIGAINTACRICQVCDKTIRMLIRADEDVREAFTSAKALYAGRIQAKLTSIVFDGIEEKIYDKDGRLVKTIHKESEQLIKLAAEGAMPDTYGRKNQDVQRIPAPIQINMYLERDTDVDGKPKVTTIQLDPERLSAPSVEIPDEGDNKGSET